jgi:hypothetical protein
MNVTKEIEPGLYRHFCQNVFTRGKRAGEPCGYTWLSPNIRPYICPQCCNNRWDVPRGTKRQDVKLTEEK